MRTHIPAVFKDATLMAQAAADCIVATLRDATNTSPRAHFVLAGGLTPRLINGALTVPRRRRAIDWTRVDFWFGDERYVPSTDPASNYGMNRETLLEPLGIPPAQVHRIGTERNPHTDAGAYDAELTAVLGPAPRFDLVLLGLGPDGHTASLFPGTVSAIPADRLCIAHNVPKLDSWRITLTPRALNGAARLIFVASGAPKAKALRSVMTGNYDPDVYPAQLIAPRAGTTTWLVDAAAASGPAFVTEPGPAW